MAKQVDRACYICALEAVVRRLFTRYERESRKSPPVRVDYHISVCGRCDARLDAEVLKNTTP